MAHYQLAFVYEWLNEISARDEAVKKAMTYAQKATEKERLYIESDYADYIENDQSKSIRILEQLANKYPKEKEAHQYLGIFHSAYANLDKAIAEYERLTTFCPKSREPFLIHPEYHYFLGKLYEQKRLKAKAAERYRRFLDLWKDADADRPEIDGARRRLAGLE